jgi:glutamyl-tRNA synthetase
MHFGNVRTALFNVLWSRRLGGKFLLRIEDSDEARSQLSHEQLLFEDLQWLGLQWDEGVGSVGEQGPYRQSERSVIYDQYYQTMIAQKLVYPCFCTENQLNLARKLQLSQGHPPRYAGTCLHLTDQQIQEKRAQGLEPTLRFKVPLGQKIVFMDGIKGEQVFVSDDIGDFIIRRANHTASFMFCNAIDDALMGVTWVMRGEDHLANTPRQIMILESLQLRKPQYAHIPLIVGTDGTKLSKRNGSLSVRALRDLGYLPGAIVNYLARLGHHYPDLPDAGTSEILDQLGSLAKQFDVAHISHSPARYDEGQLRHWQKLSVMGLSDDQIAHWLAKALEQVPQESYPLFLKLMRENIVFPQEALEWAERLFVGFEMSAQIQAVLAQTDRIVLKLLVEEACDWIGLHGVEFRGLIQQLKTVLGISGSALFMPLRAVLTGVLHGPQLADMLTLMGPMRVMARLKDGYEQYEQYEKTEPL